MQEALADAGVTPSDISAVVLAAADGASEACKAAAVASTLGEGHRLLRPKRCYGEPLGAGEGLGLLAALALGERGETFVVNALEMGGVVSSCIVRLRG
jgi:hypothetical protein